MHSLTLQQLVDRQTIVDQLHSYARAMDRTDDELGRSVFHPDATVDYGQMYQGSGYGFIDFVRQAHLGMLVHQHSLTNILVRMDGEYAASECYVTATFRIRQADGALLGMRSQGRYVDAWERRSGRWRILRRQYLHDMDESWTAGEVAFPITGARGPADASYQAIAPDRAL